MIVSFQWLGDYVELDMPVDALESRLTMAGLNHEGSQARGADTALDFEVTSNRPDCLSHIGIAREVAVLWDRELKLPAAAPAAGSGPIDQLVSIAVASPELCPRYTGRVIRGVTVGPSPPWLADRLRCVGIALVNNVVDITNYVLLECGQPLHAFDLGKLTGRQIVIRRGKEKEAFLAINHRQYELDDQICVIADAKGPVALAGVMGGADSEVSDQTTDLLIESAQFEPQSVRNTARKVNLHSPSSFRFERGVDPEAVEWASRRCCELILDLAGGQLASGAIDIRTESPPAPRIPLRFSEIPRILGIDVDARSVQTILDRLGCRSVHSDRQRVEVVPPSWRRDLTREIDLIEEVARIDGYDRIPEDARVPMVPSSRSERDRVMDRVLHLLTAAGFDEAMTLSAVEEPLHEVTGPWSQPQTLVCNPTMLRGCATLRQSLIPSLLGARRSNESLGNEVIELFEVARVYLPRPDAVPDEETMLALTSGGDLLRVKGLLDAVVHAVAGPAQLQATSVDHALFDADRSCGLQWGDQLLGYLGELSPAALDRYDLRQPTTVAEVKLSVLLAAARPVPKFQPLSPYPAVARDLNFVLDQAVAWAEVDAIVRAIGGETLEELVYQETYVDTRRLGQGKKSLLFRITLRSDETTLTRDHADDVCRRIEERVRGELGGELRA